MNKRLLRIVSQLVFSLFLVASINAQSVLEHDGILAFNESSTEDANNVLNDSEESIDVVSKTSIEKPNIIGSVNENLFKKVEARYILAPSAFTMNVASLETNKVADTVTGRVTDAETGEPLPSVNIAVKGTTTGTTTDFDGNYSLVVDNLNVTLVFSFIGYESQEVALSGRNAIDIQLTLATLEGGELVVTAFGIEREERSLGFSSQQLGSESLERSAQADILNALAGKLTGVQITSTSGSPGSSSHIVIRGSTSITGSNEPLYIVDGMPLENSGGGGGVFTGNEPSAISDIDPNSIESISVLKGASATALYGQRAANGAIIITTKGGKLGGRTPLSVNVSSSVEVGVPLIYGYQDEYLQGSNGYFVNGLPMSKGGYVEPGYTGDSQTWNSWGPHKDNVNPQVLTDLGVSEIELYDPRRQFYGNSFKNVNSVSAGWSKDNSSTYFSVSNLHDDGVVPNENFDRISAMAKFNQKLTDDITLRTSVNYITTSNHRYTTGDALYNYSMNLSQAAISFNIEDSVYPDGEQRIQAVGANNPFWLLDNSGINQQSTRLIGNASVEYKINSWLSVTEQFGVDNRNNKVDRFSNLGVYAMPDGLVNISTLNTNAINSNLSLNFNKELTPKLSINGAFGNTIEARKRVNAGFNSSGLSLDGFYNVSNSSAVSASSSITRQRMVSVYGSVQLGYDHSAFITFTGRNDWSSTLPAGSNSYFYPSVSGSLVFTDLLDIESNVLSFGNLRASIARVGSDAPPYSIVSNFVKAGPSDATRSSISYPFNGVNAFQFSNSLGNATLKPELTTEYSAGLDLRFFNSRLKLDAEYYHKTTNNLIYRVSISSTTGYGSQLTNAGSILNKGFEITVDATPVQYRDFEWELAASFTRERTSVTLAEGIESITLGGFSAPRIAVIPGENGYGVIQAQYYERNDQGQVLVRDDGYPLFKGTVQNVGFVSPDYTANLVSTFNYKNVSLRAIVDTKQGFELLNFNDFHTTLYGTGIKTADRGTKFVFPGVNENTGQPNTVEIVKDQNFYVNNVRPVYGSYVEDGSFIKLREVSISYALSPKLLSNIPVKGVNFTATGRNLWIHSDFSMKDPEGNIMGNSNAQGFYYQTVPSVRSYNFSVNVSF